MMLCSFASSILKTVFNGFTGFYFLLTFANRFPIPMQNSFRKTLTAAPQKIDDCCHILALSTNPKGMSSAFP
jgi:hypothetical protein